MHDMRKFLAPEIVSGIDSRLLAGRYASNLGGERVLLVTDEQLLKLGWAGEIEELLTASGLQVAVYSRVLPNPTTGQVHAGVEAYRRSDSDIIVAIGGGSVIDAAKGIGIIASNGGHILDYEGIDKIDAPMPPLVCIPTTCGSSADVSQFAIITDENERRKIAIVSKAAVPDVALVDPKTLDSLSTRQLYAISMDTLTHSIEAYVSKASSPITDIHALESIRIVAEKLPMAIAHISDTSHRYELMNASLHAGLAFSNASLGLVHSMAHALGGLLNHPHGECNEALLLAVCRYNYPHCSERYEKIGSLFGDLGFIEGLSNFIDNLRDHVPPQDISLSEAELGILSENALNDACTITNPREPGSEEIRELYEIAFSR